MAIQFKQIAWVIILFLTAFAATSQARTDIVGLCYHKVEPVATGRYSISTAQFRKHLEFLKNGGYKSLNSEELLEQLSKNESFDNRRLIITFDDGYKNVYDYAFPIMQEYGFKGIVCIYPSFIGSSAAMNWEQLSELLKAGWSVEPHSMTHANLAQHYGKETEIEFLHKEIMKPYEIIEAKLGNKVKFMVWPYGVYTDKTIEAAQKAGYAGAMTVDGGGNYAGISNMLIKRQIIYSTDDMNRFMLKFGMRSLRLSECYPAPGEVINQLATFSCRIDDLADYSPETHVVNAKVTGRSTSFSFDPQTRVLTGSIKTPLKAGNYFMDIYVRDKKTGLTSLNGWLFSVSGESGKSSY